ncbi:Elicitin [Phytophthora infestans]|uniref:Elicitin n=1 Tax=Phytophthora infestans TaxID=4787 RepID=A0A833WEK8_PHYIN|nr:Elicitin [Phytophthora infestans]
MPLLLFWLSILFIASSVSADDCTIEQISAVASNSHVDPCAKAMEFVEILSLAALSSDQVKLFCASGPCMALYDDVRTMGLGDCTIPSTGTSMQKDIIDPVTEACGSSGSPSSSTDAEVEVDEASSISSSSTITVSIVGYVGVTLSVMLF